MGYEETTLITISFVAAIGILGILIMNGERK